MDRKHNKKITPLAKELRKNMTSEEKHLWYDFLNKYPVRFYRQKVIGKYIADFYCAQAKLIIELDGSHHGQTNVEAYDEERTKYLENYGVAVLRIPNYEIQRNFNGVCRYICSVVEERIERGTTLPST